MRHWEPTMPPDPGDCWEPSVRYRLLVLRACRERPALVARAVDEWLAELEAKQKEAKGA